MIIRWHVCDIGTSIMSDIKVKSMCSQCHINRAYLLSFDGAMISFLKSINRANNYLKLKYLYLLNLLKNKTIKSYNNSNNLTIHLYNSKYDFTSYIFFPFFILFCLIFFFFFFLLFKVLEAK